MVIPIVGLIDIDAVVLDIGEINRIDRTLTDCLGSNLGAATGSAHKDGEQDDEWIFHCL